MLLFVAAAVAFLGCEPPCKPYWQARCRSCGETSPGCAHAREAAKRELGDAAQCEKLTRLEHASTDLARGRYCDLHEDDPRSLDELEGPWICSGLRVDFRGPSAESGDSSDPQQLVVGGSATRIHNLRHASFQVEGKLACTYWLGPHEHSQGEAGLTLLCPDAIAELPVGRLVHCLREARP